MSVTNCANCPDKVKTVEQGTCWYECSHKNHGQGPYGSIIHGCFSPFKHTPRWCPRGLGVNAPEERVYPDVQSAIVGNLYDISPMEPEK